MSTRRAKVKGAEIEAFVVTHDAVPRISSGKTGTSPKKDQGGRENSLLASAISKSKAASQLESVKIDEEYAGMNDYENSDGSEREEEDFAHNDAIAFHDRFFEASKRSKTSNATLKIDKNEVQKRMEILGDSAKPLPCGDFAAHFPSWDAFLAHDYSLLLYGLGSKLPVMKAYYNHLRAQDFDCLFFNAWREDASDKVLFDTILTDALDEKPSSSVENAIERLVEHYKSDDAYHLVIFINNIESNCIARSLDLLVELVMLQKISLVATMDKVWF